MSGGAGVSAPRELDHVIGDLEHVRVVRRDDDGRAELAASVSASSSAPCALVVELRASVRRRPRSACCGRARRRVRRARARRPRAARREHPGGARSRAARATRLCRREGARRRSGAGRGCLLRAARRTSTCRAAKVANGRGAAAVRSTPSATTRPRVGASSPASNRSSVDFPLPETPTSAVTAAPRDLGVDLVQSLDDAGLDGIALADALDEQHRLRQRAAPLRLRRGSRMLRRRRRPPRPRARAVQTTQRAATRARRGAADGVYCGSGSTCAMSGAAPMSAAAAPASPANPTSAAASTATDSACRRSPKPIRRRNAEVTRWTRDRA